ncbi:hypothetical protein RGF97_18485 [Streptomyces roseicoloratus]|uniref:Integrase n=1 Tax=Streptomyces roseicoloratus TaxID=2508722 RepID=A0ABY9RXD6_9ACTN|nr:hypothetical protein [Streptomyces roseicoloratus]WMX46429.1 hypothetical protein RGF97_18485 [Streptomyces roseicoloratus]
MNALHQHLLDSYRAARHGEPAPPVPGAHDVTALRTARDAHRITSVPAARPAATRLRRTLHKWLHQNTH